MLEAEATMAETDSPIDSTAMRDLQEPLLRTQKGGLKTMPFIIANEALARAANAGLGPNMIVYLIQEYGMRSSYAANLLNFVSAVEDVIPIIGAFLADSYFGRFRMVGFGSIVSLLGMVLMWLTTISPKSKPPTHPQLTLLLSSFTLMSIGSGTLRSSALAFGADQLDKKKDPNILDRYFGWYYSSVMTSAMLAVTCIVYLQENVGWEVGFGVPVVVMFMSVICFFMASSLYIKVVARSGLLNRLAQVIVASYKNRNVDLSLVPENGSFYRSKESILLEPTPKLRFLNKACFIPQGGDELLGESRPLNPWRICTIEQVEEFKSLINIVPFWSSGIALSIAMGAGSFSVLQASVMDRHITRGFEIPAGSFNVFLIIAVLIQVPLSNKIIPSIASKVKGRPTKFNMKQRIGLGLTLSVVATAVLAVTEFFRKRRALAGEPPLSAMWLVPYFVLMGFGDGLNGIGRNEFFYSELPKSMSSIATTLFGLGASVASLASTFIITVVDSCTKDKGTEGWLSSNLDQGHYDYFYWVITCLSLANLGYFFVCCRAYGPCKEG